jgi:hypothetical protein
VIGSASPTSIVAAYGVGGSDLTLRQVFYRIDSSGHATEYGTATLKNSTIVGLLKGLEINGEGSQIAVTKVTDCYAGENDTGKGQGIETASLLDTSGAVTTPAMPSGGGPSGYWVENIWWDRAGAVYASLVPNLSDCATARQHPAALLWPTGASPVLSKLVGDRWVKVGDGVLWTNYGPAGWVATVTGTMPAPIQPGVFSFIPSTFTTTITNGHSHIALRAVDNFAWGP